MGEGDGVKTGATVAVETPSRARADGSPPPPSPSTQAAGRAAATPAAIETIALFFMP